MLRCNEIFLVQQKWLGLKVYNMLSTFRFFWFPDFPISRFFWFPDFADFPILPIPRFRRFFDFFRFPDFFDSLITRFCRFPYYGDFTISLILVFFQFPSFPDSPISPIPRFCCQNLTDLPTEFRPIRKSADAEPKCRFLGSEIYTLVFGYFFLWKRWFGLFLRWGVFIATWRIWIKRQTRKRSLDSFFFSLNRFWNVQVIFDEEWSQLADDGSIRNRLKSYYFWITTWIDTAAFP